MTDKPQTLGDQIRALEPPNEFSEDTFDSGWFYALEVAAQLASRPSALADAAATTTPVVVADQAVDVRQAEGPQSRPARKTCLGCCHFKSEYWREPSGDGETYDSGTSADCLKAGRSICSYGGSEPAPPDWCPCAALEPDPTPALGWRAMQTAAACVARRQADLSKSSEYDLAWCRSASCIEHHIFMLSGPTDADLDREALNRPVVQAVVDAAQSVVERWKAPTWKDAGPTGQFIGALETALAKIGGAA